MESPAVPALLIGALFVEKGLITQEQLDIALEEQQRTGDRLGEILVERFGVARLDLAGALAEQWAEYERQGTTEQQASHAEVRDLVAVSDEWSGAPEESDADAAPKRPIGEIFLERGMISEAELEVALDEQRDSGRRLGEILVGKGNLSRLELASALADQWASFQKLRPPAAANGAPEPQAAVPAPVMPTPEVSPSPPTVSGVTNDQVDALRARLEALGSQLDQLSATAHEWRQPLDELSASVGERLSAVEKATADRSTSRDDDDATASEIASIAARVDELAAAIAATPASEPSPNDLLDRVEELATAFEQHESRLGDLARDRDSGARQEIDALEGRLDELTQPLAGLDELRASVSELVSRFEQPATFDDWRAQLESLANDLRDRISTIEQAPAAAGNGEAAALRAEIAELAVRIDAIPAPRDDWRADIAELTARLDRLTTPPAGGAEELRAEIARLDARLNAIPAPSDEWRDRLDELAARIDGLPVPTDEWKIELEQVAESLRTRFDRVEADLAARPESTPVPSDLREGLDALVARLDAIPEDLRVRLDRVDHDLALRAETSAIAELAERIDAIPVPSNEWRNELAVVAENFGVRVERVETGLEQRPGLDLIAGLRDELHALSTRVDADLHERDERAASQGVHVEWLAGRLSQTEGLEQRLRDEIAPLVESGVASVTERVTGIESVLEEHKDVVADVAPRLDDLTERLEKHARRIEKLRDEGPTAAEVAEALGARLEASEAVATDFYASLDERLAAVDGAVATQGAALEAFKAGVDERERLADERFAALERSQAKRSDVRELRDALARVEQHIADETAKEDTRVVAVEEAVREGLAGLALRLAESESAYFQAGDSLRRSIEHLGSAIRGADAHLAPSQGAAEAPVVATSFLAFAPSPEGYRMVELDGAPPAVGDLVEVAGSEAPLVVARLGASPLPFDRRPCAYLETS